MPGTGRSAANTVVCVCIVCTCAIHISLTACVTKTISQLPKLDNALCVRLVACIWSGQAHEIQLSSVWLPDQPLQPGSRDAKIPLGPGSRDTQELAVSPEPGSADVTISLS